MSKNKLLILGIGNVALKYLEEALASHGLEAAVMGDRTGRPEDTWASFSTARFHATSLEPAAVRDYLESHTALRESVVAVTTLFDEMLPLVEAIAQRYGWPCPGRAAVQLSDKGAAATFAGPLSPPSQAFEARAPGTLEPWLRAPNRAWIIKPACCSGGEAVGQVHGGPEAVDAVKVHLARHFHLSAERWILQPYLAGDLVSFEGYMENGTLHRMGLSRRTRIGLTEVANRFPAGQPFPSASLEAGWAGIEAMFSRASFRNGWFHCECILEAEHLYLIDTNPGRIGGATILEQVALAHGLHTPALLAHVLLLPLGLFRGLPPGPKAKPQPTLGVWYGLPETSVLNKVVLPPDSATHTRFARDGAVVPAVGTSDYAWVGMFSGLEADVLASLEALELHTDKGLVSPAFRLD